MDHRAANTKHRRELHFVLDPYRMKRYDALHEDTYISIRCSICGYRLCSS